VSRLAALEGGLETFPALVDGVRGELGALVTRLENTETAAATAARSSSGWSDVAETLGSRLEAVERRLAGDETAARLAEVERRLDAETGRADERTRVTERALRKGLAALGERLAESETAYAEAGDALRRSIERLGAAIVETDARIVGRDEPHETAAREEHGAFVAFAPTPEGYRLRVIDGSIPELGQTLELPGHDGPLLVTRIGASPIPLDARPCAYLEPAGNAVPA
jgi:hypothetical protein